MRNPKPFIVFLLLVAFPTVFVKAQSWTPHAFGALETDGVYAISIVDSQTIWATASHEWHLSIGGVPFEGDDIIVLKSHDGGLEWETYTISDLLNPGDGVGIMSFDLHAFDKDTAFLTTNTYNYECALLRTTNGGKDWEKVYEDTSAGVWIRFFNKKEGVLIGGLLANFSPKHYTGPLVSRTSDGGKTWERVTMPAAETYIADNYESLQQGCQIIGNMIWFITADGSLFRSSDKGINWEKFSTPLYTSHPDYILNQSIAFTDSLNGLAMMITRNGDTSQRMQYLYKTSDGGKSWDEVEVSMLVHKFQTIVPVPGSMPIIVAQSKNNGRTSAFTTDFGETWTTIEIGFSFSCTSFLSPTIGWSSVFNDYHSLGLNDPVMLKWNGNFMVLPTADPVNQQSSVIYPNPFTDQISIRSEEGVRAYKVFTMEGSIIRSQNLHFKDASIDLSDVQPGMYILELCFQDGTQSAHRIVAAHNN